MTLNGKNTISYEHFHETMPCYPKHLRIWGEAGTVSMGKNMKVGKRGIPMFLLVRQKIMQGIISITTEFNIDNNGPRRKIKELMTTSKNLIDQMTGATQREKMNGSKTGGKMLKRCKKKEMVQQLQMLGMPQQLLMLKVGEK